MRRTATAALAAVGLTISGAALAQPASLTLTLTCREPNGQTYYLGGSTYPAGWHPDGMRGGTITLTSNGPGQFTVTTRDATGSLWLLPAAQSRILVDETRGGARSILIASADPAIRSADTFLFRIAADGPGEVAWTFASTGPGGTKTTMLTARCQPS